jgi:hypothetical protein
MDLQLQVPICHHVDVQAPNLYTLLALTPLHFCNTVNLQFVRPHNNRFHHSPAWSLQERRTGFSERHGLNCYILFTYTAMPLPCRAVPFSAGKFLASHRGDPGSILGQSMRHVVDKVALEFFFWFQLLPISPVSIIPPILHTHLHLNL